MDRLSPQRARPIAGLLMLASIALGDAAGATEQDVHQGYLPAIRQELARLSIEASCDEATDSCSFAFEAVEGAPRFDVALRYSATTDTIYVYIDRFLPLPEPDGPSLPLARRLLELNRQLVTAKLEWDKAIGTVRLSVVVNTDSNFDRRAFRSQVRGLRSTAQRLHGELTRLTGEAPRTDVEPGTD